jgi:hypothetical protein
MGLIERRQIKFRLAVRCRSGSGARPRLRRHTEVEGPTGGLGLELLPPPEPDEVMAVVLEECEVGVVVVLLRGLCAVGARSETVVEIVPDVRAGQVDHATVGVRSDREVAWVSLRDDERAGGREIGRRRRAGLMTCFGHVISFLGRRRGAGICEI